MTTTQPPTVPAATESAAGTTMHLPQAEVFHRRCRHFTGVMERRCRAGIDYESVRSPGGGIVHPLPCFKGDGGEVSCPFASFPSDEEVAERRQRLLTSFQQRKEALAADVCPQCHARVERRQQVGRLVVARPCGHELYHGRL